ncbi:MAG TPA: hypothetical protein VM077_02265 [Candidatus Limnocylindrales bacterium]|nr:hypothetical protein [Candidatus Limnocylindrales bacterium]
MNLKLASVISFIFNPLLILFFIPFFLVYKSTNSVYQGLWWTGYSVMFLMVLAGFTFYAVKKGIFTDFDVSRRDQRPIIFGFAMILAVFYIAGLYVFRSPIALKVIATGITVGIIILSIVNTKIKASIHMATFTGFLVGIVLGYGGDFLILFLLLPLLGQARISLKRHTPREIVTGGSFGTLISLGIYWVLKYFI